MGRGMPSKYKLKEDGDDEYTGHEGPKCPWCGEIQGEWWGLSWSGDEAETECSGCGNPIIIEIETSVAFTTWQAEPKSHPASAHSEGTEPRSGEEGEG